MSDAARAIIVLATVMAVFGAPYVADKFNRVQLRETWNQSSGGHEKNIM